MRARLHEAPARGAAFDIIGVVSPRGRTALVRGWDSAHTEIPGDMTAGMAATAEAVLSLSKPSSGEGRSPSGDEVADTVLSVMEQFVDYVPDVDVREIKLLEERLGAKEVQRIVSAMYMVDQNVRLRIALDQLGLRSRGNGDADVESTPRETTGVIRAGWDWHHSVYALRGGLDLETNELLRLRAGEHHGCDFCLSLRRMDGARRVVSSELEEKLLGYEASDMPRRLKTALRLADVYMSDPVRLDQRVRDELSLDYTDEQIAEILMVVSACNHQKVRVALGAAKPAREGALSEYVVHDDGSIEVGDIIR